SSLGGAFVAAMHETFVDVLQSRHVAGFGPAIVAEVRHRMGFGVLHRDDRYLRSDDSRGARKGSSNGEPSSGNSSKHDEFPRESMSLGDLTPDRQASLGQRARTRLLRALCSS